MEPMIFLPKNVAPGRYTGGLEQPIDWKVNRLIYVGKAENSVVAIVTGTLLAPQDRDAFSMFETRYSTDNSILVYDGNALRLTVEKTNLPLDSLTDEDLLLLMVECYKAIDMQKTDYTDSMRKKYFEKTFKVEKRVNAVTQIKTNIFNCGIEEYERAPDVYVRPA